MLLCQNQSMTETVPRPHNRLIDATSPYLLQHAHNPVDWYPWGEEALARARDCLLYTSPSPRD